MTDSVTDPKTGPTIEICVDAPKDFDRAVSARVDRIELCSALAVGGLTPTPGLLAHARHCPVPVYAMIRPRAGHFCFSAAEVASMIEDIAHVVDSGLAGVVLGASTSATEPGLDIETLERLCQAAGPLGKTLHRVVDTLSDPVSAIEPAIELGFERILTAGGADQAPDGLQELARMVQAAASRIEIMAGSGVSAPHVQPLRAVGIEAFHASCARVIDSSGTRAIDPEAFRSLQTALVAAGRRRLCKPL